MNEVKKAKKHSVSLVFSNHAHEVYEYALDSPIMTFVLVIMFNVFLKRRHYPERWIKLLETSLEKGKGLMVGKLRSVTLIEGDLKIGMRISLGNDR